MIGLDRIETDFLKYYFSLAGFEGFESKLGNVWNPEIKNVKHIPRFHSFILYLLKRSIMLKLLNAEDAGKIF